MSTFKFVDALPPKKTAPPPRPHADPILVAFSEALRANSGRWAEYPNSTTAGSARTLASAINRGIGKIPTVFQARGFEAAARQDVLYVRFVGIDA